MTEPSFHRDLRRGLQAEEHLDEVFRSRGWTITRGSREEDWSGIDRHFTKGGHTRTVQYKTDWKARKYGNVFMETISNSRSESLGWALTCEADWIIYFMPFVRPLNTLVFRGDELPAQVRIWADSFRRCQGVDNVDARGNAYQTFGIKVPYGAAARVASQVLLLPDGELDSNSPPEARESPEKAAEDSTEGIPREGDSAGLEANLVAIEERYPAEAMWPEWWEENLGSSLEESGNEIV